MTISSSANWFKMQTLNWLHQTTVPTIQSGRSKDFMGSFSSFTVLLILTWFSIPRGITHLHILWASIPSLKKLTIASITLELGLLIMHKLHIPTHIIPCNHIDQKSMWPFGYPGDQAFRNNSEWPKHYWLS